MVRVEEVWGFVCSPVDHDLNGETKQLVFGVSVCLVSHLLLLYDRVASTCLRFKFSSWDSVFILCLFGYRRTDDVIIAILKEGMERLLISGFT
jgi:hypothetical protein